MSPVEFATPKLRPPGIPRFCPAGITAPLLGIWFASDGEFQTIVWSESPLFLSEWIASASSAGREPVVRTTVEDVREGGMI